MQMELSYFTYALGQQQCSIQGYPINGLMIMVSQEGIEEDTYLTVRTPQSTLVERINLDMLHQISDFHGGNADDDSLNSPGMIYVDLGLVTLDDSEEMQILLDCESSFVGSPTTISVGVAAVIDDLPEHDEIIYHYQHHTDGSFNSDAAAGVYLFKTSLATDSGLVNVKIGEDVRSTTLRSLNWFANLMGKIELDNTSMGVLFDNKYGQPLTVNIPTAIAGTITTIIKRIVQVDSARQSKATKRIARLISRKFRVLDDQTKRAIS